MARSKPPLAERLRKLASDYNEVYLILDDEFGDTSSLNDLETKLIEAEDIVYGAGRYLRAMQDAEDEPEDADDEDED